MRRTHLYLPEPALAKLKALSKKTGLPVAEHIRRAIENYLNQRKDAYDSTNRLART